MEKIGAEISVMRGRITGNGLLPRAGRRGKAASNASFCLGNIRKKILDKNGSD